MNAGEFIAKWRQVSLGERQAAQQHFLDLCELLGHPKPADVDPHGEWFCFERGASKSSGGDGWADVWKRGFFGWEYKGKHKDLKAAYAQLNEYREDLENPPLLVVCDIDRIEIHTNYTNTAAEVHTIALDDLATPAGMRRLRAVFFDPGMLRPVKESQAITETVARRVGELARTLRERGVDPHAAARFLDRVVFCMFAEDVGLLPAKLFERTLAASRREPSRLAAMLADLFAKMAGGGYFGADEIRRFNGSLFAEAGIVELTAGEIAMLDAVAGSDWSEVEPSIFGTLFERGLDPDKRSQIGAHYTSREDIETLVEPVVMAPLRREWDEARTTVVNLLTTGRKHVTGSDKPLSRGQREKARLDADGVVRDFLDRLAGVKVLDPACGSGNFLYVTLQKLLDLEREACSFAEVHGIGGHFPRVDPRQLHGIEINPYAFELAQMTVWIGYLQWMARHGSPWPADPVLKPLTTFQCKDAILDLSDPAHPEEPDWPAADYIVSNPPFLGGKLLRTGLGDEYVDRLFDLWDGRVPREADLCCYWFEKARAHLEAKRCGRAGLLATQGIRGGANRKVLDRIKQTGDIFFAESDRPWIIAGANVHVSMVGFDDGVETARFLDGQPQPIINTNLRSTVDLSHLGRLAENAGISFMGITPSGPFVVDDHEASAMLTEPNPHGRPNSEVLRPWLNGQELTGRPGQNWIIDLNDFKDEERASRFAAPFEAVRSRVVAARQQYRTGGRWMWRFERPRPEMREAVSRQQRYLARSMVGKHHFLVAVDTVVLPANLLIVFARSDDYFLGVLHSRVHEVWARAQGTQLRERESGFRYTPTTCFETFPFPWPPGREPAFSDHGPLTTSLPSHSPPRNSTPSAPPGSTPPNGPAPRRSSSPVPSTARGSATSTIPTSAASVLCAGRAWCRATPSAPPGSRFAR
jgi:hypothetical protein